MQDNIDLKLAIKTDAKLVHKLQVEAFMPIYEKYHDDETSPAKETLEKITWKITEPNSEYYIIYLGKKAVGGIRIRHHQNGVKSENINWISPIFIIPEYQNMGIAQKVLYKAFEMYPEAIAWRLDTILQETGNCHLYEKCGFVRVGSEHVINEQMTLIDYEKTYKKT